jgi:Ser/Thr protein kinase RdoA (MazF antagonist)
MLRADDGGHFVPKVTCGLEEAAATDFQVEALLHLEKKGSLNVPRIVRTKAGETIGEISDDSGSYSLRVVTWVEGEPLESQGLSERSVCDFGAALARLDEAFAGYTHPGENPASLWDLQRVLELRELIDYISDSSVRDSVIRAADDFEKRVLPVLGDLRYQVIHGDANPGNILIADDGIGFIDFGDIVRAPLVFDVAIAMSYLRSFDANPLKFLVPFVAAYHSVNPLEAREADVLFDLVRARLTTTITLLYWRLSARAENDPYRQKALEVESGAECFLAILDSIGRSEVREKLSFIQ